MLFVRMLGLYPLFHHHPQTLGGYFVVLPIRDEAGVALGPAWLPTLFTVSLLLTSVASPALSGYLASLDDRRYAVPFVITLTVTLTVTCLPATIITPKNNYLYAAPLLREHGVARVLSAFSFSMLVFFALYASCVWRPCTLLLPLQYTVRGGFFLWLSLLNVLAVSALWTVMADRFDSAEAKRLFGLLAAGATLGTHVAVVTVVRTIAIGVSFVFFFMFFLLVSFFVIVCSSILAVACLRVLVLRKVYVACKSSSKTFSNQASFWAP